MQAVHAAGSPGLDPALAAQFMPEHAPVPLGAVTLVRDRQTGRLGYLQSTPAVDTEQLSAAAQVLAVGNLHLCQLLSTRLEGEPAHVLTACQADCGSASDLPRPQREWAALQLLDVLHWLAGQPQPVALTSLDVSQLRVMPQTGYLRLTDFGGATFNAGLEALRAGRSAGVAVISSLLHAEGAAEQEVLAAWENEGAEAYSALRLALQRAYIEALVADF
jgi:hypothetical protein